jgi:uncharacterized protein
MRIFLDANILFLAALPNSRMSEFVSLLQETSTCLTNDYAIEEARRNIQAKQPARARTLDLIVKRCEKTSGLVTDAVANLAAKDIPILGGAIAGHATHLLTGDERDFGRLWGKIIFGVKVVSPRILAQELGLLRTTRPPN